MSEFDFININEDGEEYARHTDIVLALAVLMEHPNDAVIIRHNQVGTDFPLWEPPIYTHAYVRGLEGQR